MKKLLFFSFISVPVRVYSQNEVHPEGDKLLLILAILIALPVIFFLASKIVGRKGKPKKQPGSLFSRKLKVELSKDRKYRPNVLTLNILNKSNNDIDLEAPVIHFRKLWSKRKFKLTGINRYKIYPLYLEAGKTHELQIDLSVFYRHDRKLKQFHRAKVWVSDTRGKTYSSGYITLRKSLFS